MAKSFQNNNKKIIAYFLCGFLILSVLFMASGCSSDTLDYKPAQVKAFSKTTLANLYQAFSKDTKNSKAYLKAKDSNYKSFISASALRKSDLHTLVAICKKNPTNLNKAYVYACGWNTQYDRANQSNYAVCLVYYRDHFSKKARKMVSAPLEKIVESCIKDPTGKSQRKDGSHRLSNDDTLVSLMGLALIYNNKEDEEEEENSSRSNDEEEPEETEPDESEKENDSNSSEEDTPSESEPTESEPSEPTE